jgi:hypothetical protein
MTDRLKGTVSYGRTANTGNYSSKRVEMSQEFWLDEQDFDSAMKEVKFLVDKAISE